LNGKHPNIQFTSEVENNYSLNFLDVKVTRNNKLFQTSVYRKETFTGLGMRYDSFIPFSYKLNLIGCLINRAFHLCSSALNFSNELDYLREYFLPNIFPKKLVDETFAK
jgi:hypothetical protein